MRDCPYSVPWFDHRERELRHQAALLANPHYLGDNRSMAERQREAVELRAEADALASQRQNSHSESEK